jgi:hypothetical protein
MSSSLLQNHQESAKLLAPRCYETLAQAQLCVPPDSLSPWTLSYHAITPAVFLSDIASITAASIGTGIAYHTRAILGSQITFSVFWLSWMTPSMA